MTCKTYGYAIALMTLALAPTLGAAKADAATIVALTPSNELVWFDTDKRVSSKPVAIKGITGKVLGIDVRPMDKKLYAVTDKGTILTVDPKTGEATPMSVLAKPFDHGGQASVDFNPQADRLRLIGLNGTSFRVNVVTGEVAVDGSLKFDAKDANAARKSGVTAVAYTNAMANAKGTELFNLDTVNGVFALQSPPNDGIMQTRGKVEFSKWAAFDIMLDAKMDNVAYVVDKAVLYTLNLDNGTATKMGGISGLPTITDITIVIN